ncbi:hypothetical protein ACWKSP_00615 [Micromonosporaceae bacterium Da 78-11]
MIVLRRSSLLIIVIGALSTGWATPAAAHAGGLVATDARSRVVSVTPAVPGLLVEAIEDGARLRLRNGGTTPVGVPAGGGPATPAVVAPGRELIWADTRSTPVGRDLGAGRTRAWTLVLDAGGSPVTVTGELTGQDPPGPIGWWAAVVVLAVAVPLAARRLRRPDLGLAAAGVAAAAASITHVTGSTLAVESAPWPGTFVNAGGVNLLSWPLILGGAVTVLRGRPAGVLAVCAGAALTALFVLPDVTSFHRAVIPFDGPADLERVLVVLALGLGAGVAVAGAPVLRRLAAAAAEPGGADPGGADAPVRGQ